MTRLKSLSVGRGNNPEVHLIRCTTGSCFLKFRYFTWKNSFICPSGRSNYTIPSLLFSLICPLAINVNSPSLLITYCKFYWLSLLYKWLRDIFVLASGVWNSLTFLSRSGTKSAPPDSIRPMIIGQVPLSPSEGVTVFTARGQPLPFIKQQPLVKFHLKLILTKKKARWKTSLMSRLIKQIC